MKRWKKILLGILAALALLLGALCVWQWNNIQAVYTFLTLDSQQIAGNLEAKREEHHQAIEEAVGQIAVKAPTTAQSDAILSGQLSPEEVKEALGITQQLQKTEEPAEPAAPQPSGTPDDSPAEAPEEPAWTEQDLINSCVAELYGCKIDIMAVLGDLKAEALAEWNALPEEERTNTKLKEIGFAGLNRCYELEETVNDQVREILGRYRERLRQIGAGTAILDTLWDYYEDEKAAEKAYYLDKYMN